MSSSKHFYFKSSDKTPINNSSQLMRKSADKKDFIQALRTATDDDYFNRRVQTEFNQDPHEPIPPAPTKYTYISSYKSPTSQQGGQNSKAYRKYGTIYDDQKQKKIMTGGFVVESPKNKVVGGGSQGGKLGIGSAHGILKKVSGKNIMTEPAEKMITYDKFMKKESKDVFDKLLLAKEKRLKHEAIKSNKSKEFRSTNLQSYGSKQKHVIGGKIQSKVKDITNLISRYKNISNTYGLRDTTKKQSSTLKTVDLKKTTDTKPSKLYLKTEPCEEKKQEVEILCKIGEGTFGQVYKANMGSRVVAVKKVFQDKKYKNRELEILKMIKNDFVLNVIQTFYTQEKEKKGEVKEYLNVVMEYYKENLYEAYSSEPCTPLLPIEIKLYMYQLFRGLMYIHSLDICHRDIKPQNLLVNRKNYRLVICDFGSAKKLIKGEQNIAYICSRCYRAPELIFDCTNYTTMIDIWSAGCVMLELLTGEPFFLGDNNIGQLVEIIKILGTPSKTEVVNMNPDYDLDEYKFPKVKTRLWNELFPNIDSNVESFLKQIILYSPKERMNAAEALAHQYFDELREENVYEQLINKKGIFPLFNFTKEELRGNEHLLDRLLPEWYDPESSKN